MYLSRTNSCELTCSVAYEMERSDSAVDEEPTLSASLLSSRSSPAPRTLLFLLFPMARRRTNQNPATHKRTERKRNQKPQGATPRGTREAARAGALGIRSRCGGREGRRRRHGGRRDGDKGGAGRRRDGDRRSRSRGRSS
uniref:Uncharacterized protein n=1 Tax=Arundo donax TaxID=35708 RepID=A0A0A9CZI2_ARUDO